MPGRILTTASSQCRSHPPSGYCFLKKKVASIVMGQLMNAHASQPGSSSRELEKLEKGRPAVLGARGSRLGLEGPTRVATPGIGGAPSNSNLGSLPGPQLLPPQNELRISTPIALSLDLWGLLQTLPIASPSPPNSDEAL